MKVTMHIDEALLARVMAHTGARTKTHAVDLALREMDRRGSLIRVLESSPDLSPDEWRHAVDPDYDLESLRVAETPAPPHAAPRRPRPRR